MKLDALCLFVLKANGKKTQSNELKSSVEAETVCKVLIF